MSTLSTTNIKHPSSASNNVVLDSSGRVGIGTASPSTLLQVETSGTGNAELTVKNNNATPGSGRILFADQGASDAGVIQYEHDVNAMVFKTNTNECGRFDSSGNLKFNSGYGSVATAYGCRAWVNFNGQGSISSNQTIRGSGNISSVYKNGTGDYAVNFATVMPDANYASVGQAGNEENSAQATTTSVRNTAKATSSCRISTNFATSNMFDFSQVSVAFFR